MTARLNGQSLPEGWVWATFDSVTDLVTKGASPNWQGFEYGDDGITFVRSQNVSWGQLDLSSVAYLPEAFNQKQSKSIIEVDDVLLNIVGASIGRAAKATKDIVGGNLNQAVAIIRLIRPYVAVDYTVLYLISAIAQEQINSRKVDVARANLSLADIKQMLLPLAPLNEQHRIVDAIETQFTRLDAAVTALKRSQANLKRYRAAVLKAACEGRLVPTEAELAQAEGRSYEPATVFLKRILDERRRKWEAENPKKKYQEPVAPDTRALPGLPEGWCWTSIEQLASSEARSIQSGPFGSALLHSEFQLDGVLAIGIDNVLTGQFSSGKQHRISETKYKELMKFTARPLDVLITVMATLGRTCVLPAQLERAIITKHVYRITVDKTFCNPYYLMYCIWGADPVLKQLFEQAQGQTRPGINGTILKRLAIPLPPLNEQHRIVAEIERRLSLIDQLEKTIETDLARAKRLRQSILKRAFAGQLVPQDPNDEPASVLLERIQAAKHSQPIQSPLTLTA